MDPWTGRDLREVLRTGQDLERVDVLQCAQFAVMVGIAAIWEAWGVQPTAVVGHSLGEVAAACVAGALEEGLERADRRGAVLASLRRGEGGPDRMWRAWAELAVRVDVPVPVRGSRVDLPTYRFDSTRFPLRTPPARALPQAHRAGEAPRAEPPAPGARPDLRALILAEVGAALKIPAAEVPPDRPLRELGLDSALALEIRARLAARLGRPLPVSLLFDHPTAAALARHLAGEPGATVRPTPARPADEPIAIVGLACRLPGADSPAAVWDLVARGGDAIAPVPADQWDADTLYHPDPDMPGRCTTRHGGFIDGAFDFDPGFFGMSPREAAACDPQQRLFLELCWEALERAGIAPDSLAGTPTGVYAGVASNGFLRTIDPGALDGHAATGVSTAVLSGRVAYTLGLRGPALTVDTSCSSSLVAVHLARQALLAGECALALAGGVTVQLDPGLLLEFSRLRGLSPDATR